MRVAIANKPNEAFVTGGAPQKKLDVPLSSPVERVKAPLERPEQVDPNAPRGSEGEPKNSAPARAVPFNPSNAAPGGVASPVPDRSAPTAGPRAVAPAGSGGGGPAKETTAPAMPAEGPRSGVEKPPPDTE